MNSVKVRIVMALAGAALVAGLVHSASAATCDRTLRFPWNTSKTCTSGSATANGTTSTSGSVKVIGVGCSNCGSAAAHGAGFDSSGNFTGCWVSAAGSSNFQNCASNNTQWELEVF